MSTPPYQRIAAGLREQIAAGDLRPGARLPSTRRITQDWGVAVATATKAVAVLRAEGLVTSVPGVGVVVARVPGAAATPAEPARAALTKERIVARAVAVADAEGLAAVSIRRVAGDLDAAPMALYRHIASKDDLVGDMLEAVLREWRPPVVEGWRAKLETGALELWAGLRRHPWLAPTLSLTRPQLIGAGLAYMDWNLGAFAEAGYDAETAVQLHLILFAYVRGLAVNLEPEVEAEAETGLSNAEWAGSQRASLLATVREAGFDHVAGLGDRPPHDLDLDVLVRRGVGLILDGLSATPDAPGAAEWGRAPYCFWTT